jgi:protein disulfide-isomerase A1
MACKCTDVPIQNNTLDDTNRSTNDDNMEKPKLVLYYTDWCGYSRIFLPEWEKIKNSDINKLVTFDQYECDKNSEKCRENNINGYPSILLHKQNGIKISFPDTMQRNSENVIKFVQSLF